MSKSEKIIIHFTILIPITYNPFNPYNLILMLPKLILTTHIIKA